MAMEAARSLLARRLVIVSGKGGTGKTTVSAALALAAARAGKRVMAVEVGRGEHLPPLLAPGTPAVGYAGRELRPGLTVMRIDPFEAMAEYLGLRLGSKSMVDFALRNPGLRQLLEGAPGWRELITLGKVWHLEQMEDPSGNSLYDLIVVDAPATGHGVTFLDVPRVVHSAVHTGPLGRNAGMVEELIRDPDRTVLLPVTLAEELPAQETGELVERLRDEIGIAVDRVVVNAVAPTPFPPGCEKLDERLASLAPDVSFDRLPSPRALAGSAAYLRQRHDLNSRYLEVIAERTGLPLLCLPMIPGGPGRPGALEALADLLLQSPSPHGVDAAATLPGLPPLPSSDDAPKSATPAAPTARSAELLQEARVVVCVGTGGVGKTTIAAAIALESARRGARALVLTIDPARRLADALGIGELGNEPRALPAAMRERLGIAQGGQLSAMMLDMKRTFDDMVTRFADGPEMRDRILANPIYQHVSDALAGSGEYAAMEKVYEMLESDQFDLIVLDTPPSQHALDFLAAPRRLTEFLESRLVKLLVHPAFSAGRFGWKIFQGATTRVIGVIERVTGVGFLEDISEFLVAFEGMSEGFRERASHVQAMLLGPDSRFVLVAAPSAEAARDSVDFLIHLERTSVPLAGVVINRAHLWSAVSAGSEDDPATAALRPDDPALSADISALERALIASGSQGDAGELARAAVNAASQYAELVRLDRHESRDLRNHAAARSLFVRTVPEFPMDVHDLDGLCRIGGYVFGEQADDADHGW